MLASAFPSPEQDFLDLPIHFAQSLIIHNIVHSTVYAYIQRAELWPEGYDWFFMVSVQK